MADAKNIFGRFFKEIRLKTGLSLRGFCLKHGLDAGNISKLERGMAAPPQSREILEKYAGYLGITESSDDWYSFFDYAAASAGRIPPDMMNDAELVESLPLVFRTLRSPKLTADELRKLAEAIRRT
jgi:transcriptional regulator with XRE-family HTH domain